MNERIKELAEQADMVKILEEHAREYGNGIFENTPYPELEKFAELIVGECILTIQMGITRDGHNTEKYLRSMKHIRQIREHFGVVEE
jgi:hypothetical protein